MRLGTRPKPLKPGQSVGAASGPASNRLSTLGAAFYRAGRFEEAVRQLDRSVEAHSARGTPFDALFLAMAYHRLGLAVQARDWLRRGTAAARTAMREANPRDGTSWIPRLQLEILGREAASLINPDGR